MSSTTEFQMLIDEIKMITKLSLTDYGASKLLAFPLEVVKGAIEEYRNSHSAERSFDVLYRLCRSSCNTQGINPNIEKARYVAESLSLKFTDKDFIKRDKVQRFNEPPEQKAKWDDVLKRSQERIKAKQKSISADKVI